MAASTEKYWVCTVSRAHVKIGEAGGFCQVCHGKKGPLARMRQGDWIIYYSPKESLNGVEACQKFTAIGQIADENVFQYQMSEDFIPFRRNVVYLQQVREISIYDLLEHLSFTKETKNWGAKFRFGVFEINKDDFDLIYREMVRGKTN